MAYDPKTHEVVLVQDKTTKLWHGEVVTERKTAEFSTKKEALGAANDLAFRIFGPNIAPSVIGIDQEV